MRAVYSTGGFLHMSIVDACFNLFNVLASQNDQTKKQIYVNVDVKFLWILVDIHFV